MTMLLRAATILAALFAMPAMADQYDQAYRQLQRLEFEAYQQRTAEREFVPLQLALQCHLVSRIGASISAAYDPVFWTWQDLAGRGVWVMPVPSYQDLFVRAKRVIAAQGLTCDYFKQYPTLIGRIRAIEHDY